MDRPLQKPHWLPAADWHSLLALHGGTPFCSVCNTADNLSVDHIISRHYDGTHDLSNLDFKCVHHNSQKGARDDYYWSQPYYWDSTPDVRKFRTAQWKVYDSLTQDPEVSAWFAQPASQIAGKLYLLAWVVGAGKTLAVSAVAHAYNYAQTRLWGAVRRADHILILTKEQNVRDQIAEDLEADIVRMGILPTAPRVAILDNYNGLCDERWLHNQDVVVACVHMFWGRNGEPKRGIIDSLGKFSLIFIDEPHFAHTQVQKLLKATPRSVVFGLTGSPIRRDTNLLSDYVLLSEFTYQDAHERDQSVKHLDPVKSLHRVRLESADVLADGHERIVTSPSDPDYDGTSLVTAGQVASYVIRLIQELDAELPGRPAPHRDGSVAADLLYPAHAMIKVPSRALADMLQKQIQAYFNGKRRTFPKAGGWNCSKIFLGTEGLPGERLNPKSHPWLQAYKNGIDEESIRYVCDSECARILIVVGMGREGVNNPLCCITASVDSEASVIEAVQRWWGRALRSVTYIDISGVRHFAPDRLDAAHFVYHESSTITSETAKRGINWLLNMHENLDGLHKIGDLVGNRTSPVKQDPPTIKDPLTPEDKVAIAVEAAAIGGECWRDDDEAVSKIIKTITEKYAPDNPGKADRCSKWVGETLRESPEDAFRMTGHIQRDDLPHIPVVMDEREKHDPQMETLKEWVRRMQPNLVPHLPTMTIGTGMHEAVLSMYREWANQGILPQVQPGIDLGVIRDAYTSEVIRFLKNYIEDRGKASGVAKNSINIAFRIVLYAPKGEPCAKGTKWDCPQVHTLLQRPDIKRAILGFTRTCLIKEGLCPKVASAFNVRADA